MSYLSDRDPFTSGSRDAKKAEKKSGKLADELYNQTGKINAGLNEADKGYKTSFDKSSGEYLPKMEGLVGQYSDKINRLDQDAEKQATDASATYTNSILPGYKDAMSKAKVNADSAMTLKDAMDPNNSVMKGVRDLYNQQGETARKQGMQDFGVLSALGAQAAQGQFGGASPMTAGMMGQIYAQNQGQAGNAYAKAQQRMYDLQQQGLDKSFDQSNKMYDAGQQAQNTYSNSIKDLQTGENSYLDQQSKIREDRAGYGGSIFDANSGLAADKFNVGMAGAGIDKNNAYGKGGREQDALNTKYGVKQQGVSNTAAAQGAQSAGNMQFMGTLAGAGATAYASDEKEKKKIASVSDQELDEFLKAVKPKTFDYKNDKPGTAPGRRIGFMLQDVEGTKLGDKMTKKADDGRLMYDKQNMDGILLAGLSRLAKKAG